MSVNWSGLALVLIKKKYCIWKEEIIPVLLAPSILSKQSQNDKNNYVIPIHT